MGTVAVQTTTKAHFADRWNKIIGKDMPKDKKGEDKAMRIRANVLACLSADWVIEVHGWAGANDVRVQEVTNESLVSLFSDEEQENLF